MARLSMGISDRICIGDSYYRHSRTYAEVLPMKPAAGKFGIMLREYRERQRYSMNGLAKAIGVDATYIMTLEQGRQIHPSKLIVLAMAKTLELDDLETDKLLYRADLAPLTDWQSVAETSERLIEKISRMIDGIDDIEEEREERRERA